MQKSDQNRTQNRRSDAAQERSSLKNTRVLTTCALLVAIGVILGFFKLPITNVVEIRFQGLPIAVAGAFFGPALGGVVGGLVDVLAYVVRPTGAYFPGFTITSIMTGMIFGAFLHREVTLPRVLAAQCAKTLVCGILLNSLWLSMLYGNAFTAVLAARVVKEVVMIPIDTAILMALLGAVRRTGVQRMAQGKA